MITPEWLDLRIVVSAALGALPAFLVVAFLVWSLWRSRRQHCDQIRELQDLVRYLIEFVDPEDLFVKPPLPEPLRVFRADYDRIEREEAVRER
jgi:hypothetical protein